jgi:hypothetical protein
VLFEPGDRLGVEVVGRLVEEEDVWLLTGVSGGGQRKASIAISRRESRSQASAASSRSCTSPCRSRSFDISSSDISSPNRALISSNSLRSETVSETASSTTSRTVFDSSSRGSCSRKPTE